jgi:hypothetical protein
MLTSFPFWERGSEGCCLIGGRVRGRDRETCGVAFSEM